MPIQVGRLRKCGFAREGAFQPAYPQTTFVPPALYTWYIPPEDWFEKTSPLESHGVGGFAELPTEVVPGPKMVEDARIQSLFEPVDDFITLVAAIFGTDTPTVNPDGSYTHAFTRLQNALLPLFSWQFDAGNAQLGFTGAMLDTAKIEVTAKQIVSLQQSWKALRPASPDPAPFTFSPTAVRQPLPYHKVQLKLGGAVATNIRKVDVDFKNHIMTDHTVQNDTRSATRIWSEGWDVEVTLDALFEDVIEYTKFRDGLKSSFELTISGFENVPGSAPPVPFSFHLTIPHLFYKQMNLPLAEGVVTLAAAGTAVPERDILQPTFGHHTFMSVVSDKVAAYV